MHPHHASWQPAPRSVRRLQAGVNLEAIRNYQRRGLLARTP